MLILPVAYSPIHNVCVISSQTEWEHPIIEYRQPFGLSLMLNARGGHEICSWLSTKRTLNNSRLITARSVFPVYVTAGFTAVDSGCPSAFSQHDVRWFHDFLCKLVNKLYKRERARGKTYVGMYVCIRPRTIIKLLNEMLLRNIVASDFG